MKGREESTGIPQLHRPSDVTFVATIEDGDGVPINWYSLSNIHALMVPEYTRGQAHECDTLEISEDGYKIIFFYASNYPQYLGISRILLSADLFGRSLMLGAVALDFVSDIDGAHRKRAQSVTLRFVLK